MKSVMPLLSVIASLLLFVLLSAFTGRLYAAEKMRVAVIDFEANDIPEQEAAKISELIRTDLIKTGKFQVIERRQMGQILREQELQQTGCTDVTCAVEMGKILSANKIMVGSVIKIGYRMIITGRIVDVESGIAEHSAKTVALSDADIISAVTDFTEKITGSVNRAKFGADYGTIDSLMYREQGAVKKPVDIRTTYFTGFVTSLGFSGVFFGLGYYNDYKIKKNQASYDDLAVIYNTSTDSSLVSDTRLKMNDLKKEADASARLRNTSLGIGSVLFLVSGFLYYKYYTSPEPEKVSVNGVTEFYPFLYTDIPKSNFTNDEYRLTAGLTLRF